MPNSKTKGRLSGELHVPRMRWGGRWRHNLEDIAQDSEWHFLAKYGRTSGYQVARALQVSREVCALPWEFGAKTLDTHSEVWVRWNPQDDDA